MKTVQYLTKTGKIVKRNAETTHWISPSGEQFDTATIHGRCCSVVMRNSYGPVFGTEPVNRVRVWYGNPQLIESPQNNDDMEFVGLVTESGHVIDGIYSGYCLENELPKRFFKRILKDRDERESELGYDPTTGFCWEAVEVKIN